MAGPLGAPGRHLGPLGAQGRHLGPWELRGDGWTVLTGPEILPSVLWTRLTSPMGQTPEEPSEELKDPSCSGLLLETEVYF